MRSANGAKVGISHVQKRALDNVEPTYNLEIDVDHTFHVGEGSLLVHNGIPKDAPGFWNYVLGLYRSNILSWDGRAKYIFG